MKCCVLINGPKHISSFTGHGLCCQPHRLHTLLAEGSSVRSNQPWLVSGHRSVDGDDRAKENRHREVKGTGKSQGCVALVTSFRPPPTVFLPTLPQNINPVIREALEHCHEFTSNLHYHWTQWHTVLRRKEK